MVQHVLRFFGVAALMLASPVALACSCMHDVGKTPEEQVAQARASADVVVLAYALNVVGHDPMMIERCEMLDDGTATDDCEEVVQYRREVAHFVTERTWKGEPGQEFRIGSQSMCDAVFRTGKTYLIYMYESDTPGLFTTSFCARTREAQRAEDDIRILDNLPRSSGADEETDKLSLILDAPERNGAN